MPMLDKNPDLLAWLQAVSPSLYAFGLSITVAALRVIYGGGGMRQAILEGSLCGLATLTMVPLLEWLGLPSGMATFAGGLVGFLGVDKFRQLADRIVTERVG
ncbi:phage holin, lambda family [Pseudomonas helleri]|jgi:lambda family phage holin|uniref:phage holin, lambda family n=1 Tax=Pseudomonas helleri TaxID=1608996 RepID=UPI003F97CDFE